MTVYNQEREFERDQLAHQLWRTPYNRFLHFGIGSYRDVTSLDRVGLPVWTSFRPLASAITVSAGKSLEALQAFAGAIAEAIEFWAAENPWGKTVMASLNELEAGGQAETLPWEQYQLARDNVANPNMNLSWELVDRIEADATRTPLKAWMPSDLIWLEQRSPTQFTNFQSSSNGVASGVRAEDAVLSGLYELVERDAWTISQVLLQTSGEWPGKVPLTGLPEELDLIVKAIEKAGLFAFLFDVTTSLGIPVFGCWLFDPGPDGAGTFGGYGASLNPRVAARRALLESVQSRLCYISAARDDLYRRDFLLLKKTEQTKVIATARGLPCAECWDAFAEQYGCPVFSTITEELKTLVAKLCAAGFTKLYSRTLCEESFGPANLTVVRVIAPQLEALKFDMWQTNGRATTVTRDYLNKKVEALRHGQF